METEFCTGSGKWAYAIDDPRYAGQLVCSVCGARVHRQVSGFFSKDDLQARAVSHMRYKQEATK